MSDFDFSSGKQFSRLTLGRAETVNARFSEVATAIATKLDKAGGSITGALSLSGNLSIGGTLAVTSSTALTSTLSVGGAATFSSTVLLAADPTLALQAATKQYTDAGDATLAAAITAGDSALSAAITAGDATRLPLAGGTMSGAIAMGGNKVTGAANGTDAQDLVTLSQLAATAFSSALPSQTGNAGKFVTTDGTNASWGTVLPIQTGKAGQFLTTDGANASWAAGGGTRNFTATGTLPNGATVVLNSDGTVSTVTSNNDTTGTATVFRSLSVSVVASAALSSTKVVVCYYDGTNAQAVIGTITGTSISFGTAVTFQSGSTLYISVCALSSTSFVIAYSTSTSSARCIVGSVSGTTISFPSPTTVFNGAETRHISIAALSSTAVVIAYQDTGNASYGTAIIGTISGTTITFGSEYVFTSGVALSFSVAALSSTSFVVSYHRNGSSNGDVIAASVSGQTTITFGTAVTFDSTASAPTYTSIVALTSTTFMVAWARSTTDGRAKIGTVSGTTVSFTGASDVVFNNANTAYISLVKLSATSVLVSYRDEGNSNYGTLCLGAISGLNITFGSEIVFRSGSVAYLASCSLSSAYTFIGFFDGNSGGYGTGVVFQQAATNVQNWIGISAAATSSGASGPVTILSGVNTGVSGLTTGSTYYLNNDGSLTTTATSYKIGKALSATSLLITGSAQ